MAAQARDLERVCHLNGAYLNCRRTMDYAGGTGAVPSEPPVVTGTRYHPKEPGGTAGRVLVVEGKDGLGRPYRTEVFVFRENRFHFKAINAVYWSGSGSSTTTLRRHHPRHSRATTSPEGDSATARFGVT